ncbi:hypothetical protein GKZ68_01265 [Hymenobacter sp. BRD128]|uniref:hypothetical protein n=1 Tax=Hymenobacter sp. BRD128 TaxID=2675878 RepID=UPI0015662EA9|nr:hypothetical protein [Hymenobacter sp. BRD128]QKG55384.1 hypothetical protein GKZ68_01265 [Hymenobacter sp. BRD128]
MKPKYFALGALALLLGWFVFDSLSQPGVGDLRGDFQQVAMYRNENNTGPIIRVYAVTVADTLWREMRQYGDFMPHTKYGNTKVYFFRQGQPVPKTVQPGTVNFAPAFARNCLAEYEKEVMGNVTFQRYPLR